MAWPNLSGIVKVVVTYGFDGKPAINVHFVLLDTPTSPIPTTTLLATANAFWSALDTQWSARMGDLWQVDDIIATDWSVDDGEFQVTNQVLPIVGQETIVEIPANVALVVSHRTGRIGRARRGRTYLPGLTEASTEGNTIQAAVLTTAAAYFTALDTGLAAIDQAMVVYSLYDDGAKRTTPVATPVTSRIINNRADTQRRRLPAS